MEERVRARRTRIDQYIMLNQKRKGEGQHTQSEAIAREKHGETKRENEPPLYKAMMDKVYLTDVILFVSNYL